MDNVTFDLKGLDLKAWLQTWHDLRHKARTDLLWLCNNVLGYKDVSRAVHGPILDALQHFPGANEFHTTAQDYLEATRGKLLWEPRCVMSQLPANDAHVADRQTLFLFPRGHLKSTAITLAHSIQWILNYPNVRILLTTATETLVTGFVIEIRQHFITNEVLRQLFPELCPQAKEQGKVPELGNLSGFTIPGRDNTNKKLGPGGKEPTLLASTVGSAITGYHGDVLKALDVATPIPTPCGWRTMGDLVVGDLVYGANGLPTVVTGAAEARWSEDVYEVEFSTGDKIVCDGGHQWITDTIRDRMRSKHRGPKPSSKTASEIADSLMALDEYNHRVSVAGVACGNEYDLPIAPYAFGAWLGDGTSRAARITIGPEDREEMMNLLEACGEPVRPMKNRYLYGFGSGKANGKRSEKMTAKLRGLEVYDNKHIPAVYQKSSAQNRLDLLRGLMDTDGTVSKTGACSFSGMNRRLVEDVRELLCSLGYKPSACGSGLAKISGRVVGTCYWVVFYAYPDMNPFGLPRKRARVKPQRAISRQKYRQIVAMSRAHPRKVRCISVDAPDHQFLAGKAYIPTHNCDDLVEKLNSSSQNGIDDVIRHFGSMGDLLEKYNSDDADRPLKGWIDLVGTPWDFSDLYQVIRNSEAERASKGIAPDWNLVIRSAAPNWPDGPYLWPQRMGYKALKAIEDNPTQGPAQLSAQYLMTPIVAGQGLVDDLKQLRWMPDLEMRTRIVPKLALRARLDLAGMDVNAKGADNDYTCLTVGGFLDGQLFVPWMNHGRPPVDEVIEWIFDMFNRFPQLVSLVVEKASGASPLETFLRREMSSRNRWLPIEFVGRSNRQSKVDRIKGLRPWFKSGDIIFSDGLPYRTQIESEIKGFPKFRHDDILDTVSDLMHEGRMLSGGLISDPAKALSDPLMSPLEKMLAQMDRDYGDFADVGAERYSTLTGFPT